jgi:hypothetical protein
VWSVAITLSTSVILVWGILNEIHQFMIPAVVLMVRTQYNCKCTRVPVQIMDIVLFAMFAVLFGAWSLKDNTTIKNPERSLDVKHPKNLASDYHQPKT